MPGRIGKLTGSLGTAGLRRANTRAWAYPALAAVVLAVVGFWANGAMERSLRDETTTVLETVRDANVTALRVWIDQQKAVTEVAAGDPQVRALAQELVAAGPAAADAASTREALHRHLEPMLEAHNYAGFEIIDENGRFLASTDANTLGKRMKRTRLDDGGAWGRAEAREWWSAQPSFSAA